MTTFVARAKDIFKNLHQDEVVPENVQLLAVASSLVFSFPNFWQQLLTLEGMVVNPADPENLIDIGVLTDPEDPLTWVKSDVTTTSKMKAWHVNNEIRRFCEITYVNDQVSRPVIDEAEVGQTASETKTIRRDTASAEIEGVLGDPTIDVEDL